MKKSTDELQKELSSIPNLTRFLAVNQEHFVDQSFLEMLTALVDRSGMSKSTLARRALTSEVYLYQILSGGRMPSRDRTICLCFGLSATLEETQTLLKQCGYAQLYARDRRDAIILYGIVNGMSLFDVNDKLFSEEEETLF